MADEVKSGDVLKTLQVAVKGMTFPSDADKPIKAVLWTQAELKDAGGAVTGIHPVDEAELRATGKVASGGTVETLSVDDFFAPVVEVKDWFGDEEKATAARFGTLVDVLKAQLTNVSAFRVSGGHSDTSLVDVLVLGTTMGGDVAGVTTQLVET